jgi:outer membrane PBP1 activator LpoA protein
MRLPYAVGRVFTSSLPRRLSIACAAASLVLGGCSTYEAGTPKAAVNYQEPPAAKTENHVRSLEQVIKDQHDWYQMLE